MGVILRPVVLAAALIVALPLSAAAERPNIIVILMDDMGYGDVRAYNAASKIPTPSLDRLAAEGMRFTDAHSPSSVCTPTRYALMTGRYAWRSRLKEGVLWGYDRALIEPGRLTLPSLLRRAGYATAGVGKWHLGLGDAERIDYTAPLAPGPSTQGFDYFFGIPASLDMDPYVYFRNDRVEAPPTASDPGSGECCTGPFWRKGPAAPGFKPVDVLPRITEHAGRYVDERAKSRQPFFLYVAFASPHTPWVPTSEYRGRSGAGEYGDFMVQTDASIGRILDALDRHKMADNTLVIATSDNGAYWRPQEIAQHGHRANHTWRGMKADIFEAGHRVPFIARQVGRIAPGTVSDALITLADIIATAASIVGVPLPPDAAEDSFDFSAALLGKTDARPPRDAAVHHAQNGMFAIRQGPWKLIEGLGSGGFTAPREIKPGPSDPPGQLYNLAEDPGETTNVYDKQPDVVKSLRLLLGRYKQTGRSRPIS
jgi:arylsulfatase A